MKVGEKPAMKLQIEYHRIEIISGVLRPMRSASQPERGGAEQAQPQRDGEDKGDLGQRDVKFVRDRHHDQQEDGEVERIERPAQPGGPPGQPLILGRFLPPRNVCAARLRTLLDYLPGVRQNGRCGTYETARHDVSFGTQGKGFTRFFALGVATNHRRMAGMRQTLIAAGGRRQPRRKSPGDRRVHAATSQRWREGRSAHA